ncbi:MAG TPA: transcription antitermination factor NusB [Steroidobacteraceae bacterium]|nr:transcription antitermination factor NusB [Steroidobacteraceae bacterium]
MSGAARSHGSGRAVARKLALQALYGWQLNPVPWQDLVQDFAHDEDMPKADAEHFRGLVQRVCEHAAEFDALLAPWLDRPAAQLDPIERALLWLGACELREFPDVPFRVVINEAVRLAKRYGATDGHRYVNGVLDRAAREWRAAER